MSEPERQAALRAAHDAVASDADFHLEARDVALLLLARDDLQGRSTPTYVVSREDLQVLSGIVDKLASSPQVASERRLNESIERLLKADCISRADLSRLGASSLAQYQLTPIGEAIAGWQLKQSELQGEPLSAILAAFIVQLAEIDRVAMAHPPADVWRSQVAAPLQYVVRELLAAIQRHQQVLDRAHDTMRAFVPSLLKESSEDAIDRCKSAIDSAMRTIRDLIHVTVDSANVAFGLLDSIEQCAEAGGHLYGESPCEDVRRRLETIVEWTTQRHKDWGAHFDSVHSFLRFVSMVDRNRKVTEALKQSISEVPCWSLFVTDAGPLLILADHSKAPTQRAAVKRPRADFVMEETCVDRDQLPDLIRGLVDVHRTNTHARWSEVAREAMADHGRARVIPRLPSIMTQLLAGRIVDNDQREMVTVDPAIQLEELLVRRR